MADAETWLDFWNGSHRIYVNERHRDIHYRKVAADIAGLVPRPDATVADWGCGDALHARDVAKACGQLILCDAAEATRERLRERFGGEPRIQVLAPAQVVERHAGRVDLMVVNSVLQYLTSEELDRLLADARTVLAPAGTLVIADVIPPDDDLKGDILNLLGTAARHGFLIEAFAGLVSTFFSPYRKLRGRIGLARHSEADLLARLRAAGFRADRLNPNLGFDQRRMAFRAQRA